MEGITDGAYVLAWRVCKDFEIIKFVKILKLVTISWLAFSKRCIIVRRCIWELRYISLQIYELDMSKLCSAPGLAWQAALKKTKVELDVLTDLNMLFMVEKGIRGGISHSIYQYA